jgi:NADPH-dependent curcumin reductase CurA
MTPSNTRVIFKKRPELSATPDCFDVITEPLPTLGPNEVRVAVEYLSVDAGVRTMLRGEGFHRQVPIGGTILAGGVGRIIESTAEGWEPGQAVNGGLGAQTIATIPIAQLKKVTDMPGLPLSVHLGVLGGSTGVTAWIGMRHVARPKAGDTFVLGL